MRPKTGRWLRKWQKRSRRGSQKHELMPARGNIPSSEKHKACSTLGYELFRPSLAQTLIAIRKIILFITFPHGSNPPTGTLSCGCSCLVGEGKNHLSRLRCLRSCDAVRTQNLKPKWPLALTHQAQAAINLEASASEAFPVIVGSHGGPWRWSGSNARS